MAKIKSIIEIPGKYNLQTRTVTFFRSGNIAKKVGYILQMMYQSISSS